MPRLVKVALATLALCSAVLAVIYALLPRPDDGMPLSDSLRELGFPGLAGVAENREGLDVASIGVVPAAITNVGADPTTPGSLLLTLLNGRIVRLDQSGTVGPDFATLDDLVSGDGGEQGLLGIAFSPHFVSDGRVYVNYTDKAGDTVVARFVYSPETRAIDEDSLEIVLTIDQPYANHNGGQLAFGPDGMLYIATGDGGGGGDPDEVADRLDSLLGKIVRIDVSPATGYEIPPDNPFVGQDGARGEIWAYGLRNPWRFSFDPRNGDLYIADVGQNLFEEVDVLEASTGPGWNLGWDSMEGSSCFEPAEGCVRDGLEMPVHTYGHDAGCSITGGVILPDRYGPHAGSYVFADFCAGTISTLSRNGDRWMSTLRVLSGKLITTFGFDHEGLVVFATVNGEVFRLTPPP